MLMSAMHVSARAEKKKNVARNHWPSKMCAVHPHYRAPNKVQQMSEVFMRAIFVRTESLGQGCAIMSRVT